MSRPGQRDLSACHLTRHALERFVERFGVEPDSAEPELRQALRRTRRLGRNAENGAVAALRFAWWARSSSRSSRATRA